MTASTGYTIPCAYYKQKGAVMHDLFDIASDDEFIRDEFVVWFDDDDLTSEMFQANGRFVNVEVMS